jgi:hypothetical protein
VIPKAGSQHLYSKVVSLQVLGHDKVRRFWEDLRAGVRVKPREPHPIMTAPKLLLRDQLDHCHMHPGSGPGSYESLLYLFQVLAVKSIPLLEVLLHLVICFPKAVELCCPCLPMWHF